MSKDQWTVISVGVAPGLLALGLAGGLRGEVADLREQVGSVDSRLSHIEGWIQGQFREGTSGD